MVVLFIAVLGLCLGSFVNALVWRLRLRRQYAGLDSEEDDTGETTAKPGPWRVFGECLIGVAQEILEWLKWPFRPLLRAGKPTKRGHKKPLAEKYSLSKGRSMCPRCEHELAAKDLVPVFSWLWLRGKCRYCHKPISWQYPLVELLVALAFTLSYLWWPNLLAGYEWIRFGIWLVLLVGFAALAVYDARWKYLPNELLHPLIWVTAILVTLNAVFIGPETLLVAAYGLAIIWGLFFAIYCAGEVLGKRWIGYGDVRLAVLLGLIVGGPWPALFTVFLASLLGTLVAVPLLASKHADRTTELPYGPFLLVASVICVLGTDLFLGWLDRLLML